MSTFLLIAAIVCALGAVASLLTGVIGMSGREFNNKYGNKLMQARVALQAIAIALLLVILLTAHG